MDQPSPKISIVTPCFVSDMPRPSTSSDSVAHDSMLMNPGATAMPLASSVARDCASDRSPTAATRSPIRPTSARRPSPPLPS